MSDGLTNTLFSVMFQKKEKRKRIVYAEKQGRKKKENRVAVCNIFFLWGNDLGVLRNGSDCWFGLKNCHHQQPILLILSLSHRTAGHNQPEAIK